MRARCPRFRTGNSSCFRGNVLLFFYRLDSRLLHAETTCRRVGKMFSPKPDCVFIAALYAPGAGWNPRPTFKTRRGTETPPYSFYTKESLGDDLVALVLLVVNAFCFFVRRLRTAGHCFAGFSLSRCSLMRSICICCISSRRCHWLVSRKSILSLRCLTSSSDFRLMR